MTAGTKRVFALITGLLICSVFAATTTFDAITATTVNKVTITAPASAATLTIPNGVTLTGPASSGTAMTLGNTETVTGVKTFGSAGAVGRLKIAGTTSGTITLDATAVAGTNTLTLPAATDTLVGKATTDTLTNKTISGASNTLSAIPYTAVNEYPKFRAHKNGTDQTVSASTVTKATFGTESYDVGSFYDTTNSRWTPPSGKVLLRAKIHVATLNASDTPYIMIYKNGSEIARMAYVVNAGGLTMAVTTVDSANGSDYYEVFADSRNATGWSGLTLFTEFSGEFMP